MMSEIENQAAVLDNAALQGKATEQIDPKGEMPLSRAYAIQAASMQQRLGRGERRTGVKMGFTSRSKMLQMGISDVIWGSTPGSNLNSRSF